MRTFLVSIGSREDLHLLKRFIRLADVALSQPSKGEQVVCFNCLDLHHKHPDSGERQKKSTIGTRRFVPALRVGGTVPG